MRPINPFRKALGVLAVLPLILLLITAPPASAAAASPPSTWTLSDGSAQHVCHTPGNNPVTFGYFLASVVGDWKTTVTVQLTELPPRSTSYGAAVLPPGSNYPHEDGGITVNGFLAYEVTNAPLGLYHPKISATDGLRTESFPVTLEMKQSCY